MADEHSHRLHARRQTIDGSLDSKSRRIHACQEYEPSSKHKRE